MSDARIATFRNPTSGTSRNTLAWNWPIAETPLGTRLCRPSEAVLDIPPSPRLAPLAIQDGKLVIDIKDRRVTC